MYIDKESCIYYNKEDIYDVNKERFVLWNELWWFCTHPRSDNFNYNSKLTVVLVQNSINQQHQYWPLSIVQVQEDGCLGALSNNEGSFVVCNMKPTDTKQDNWLPLPYCIYNNHDVEVPNRLRWVLSFRSRYNSAHDFRISYSSLI